MTDGESGDKDGEEDLAAAALGILSGAEANFRQRLKELGDEAQLIR